MVVFASAPAPAQDFTAGKTPAQLFSSDCAECHHSPNGLGRGRDVRTLAGFLRQHYTTKSQTASALAVYVAGFSGGGAAGVNNRGAGVAAPANTANERPQADRRTRTDSEAAATGEDTRPGVRPVEDPAARRPRPTNPSGDGEKRRARNDGDVPRPPASDVPRPPASIATTAPASVKLNAPAGDRAPHAATDPISRLRSYLSSGLGFESTVAEAAKMGAPRPVNAPIVWITPSLLRLRCRQRPRPSPTRRRLRLRQPRSMQPPLRRPRKAMPCRLRIRPCRRPSRSRAWSNS